MNTCDKCRFIDGPDCNHMNNLYTDPTTGNRNFTLSAINQRTLVFRLGEQCGPDGKWFEPKSPEIFNCPEGHKAFLSLLPEGYSRVHCDKPPCWLGPGKPTQEEAIQVWNHMTMAYQSLVKPNTPDE